MYFQSNWSLRELHVIGDWLCVTDIAETSLNRLLLFFMLKSSDWSCFVEKGVIKFLQKNTFVGASF